MGKEICIQDLVDLVKGRLVGNIPEGIIFNGTCGIDNYLPHKVSFVKNKKYVRMLGAVNGAVVLIDQNFAYLCQAYPNNTYIIVGDTDKSMWDLQEFFYRNPNGNIGIGIAQAARIHPSATLGKDVFVGENVVVGQDVVVGNRAKIMANSVIMDNVKVGEGTVIYPGVVIYWNCQIGNDVILHSGACIGNEGSRFEQTPGQSIRKLYQMGNVIIGDRVEIGCNSAINRATFEGGATVIAEDVKIDDLISIAHNVKIGARTVIIALATVAGSSRIGEDVWIGAGATISNGLTVGNGAKILLNAVVAYDVAENEIVSGFYAMPHRQWKKVYRRLVDCGREP